MVENEKQEAVVPDEIKDFVEMLKDHEVKEGKAIAIAKYISRTGSPEVFEKPEELTDYLSRWPRDVVPVQRRRILEQWFAERGTPLTEEFLAKTAMHPKEAQKLTKKEEKHKKAAEGEVWVVRVDDKGIPRITMAAEDETGISLEEAKRAVEEIRKSYVGEEPLVIFDEKAERHMPNFKSEFVKANPTVAWAAARQMDKAMAEGEELDPMDVMIEQMARTEQIREAVGGRREPETKGTIAELISGVKDLQDMAREGKVEMPSWLSDPAAFIDTVQKVSGGGERGTPEWMTDPSAFIDTVRKIAGEPKGDEGVKEELGDLRKALEEMKEERHREETARQQQQIQSLSNKLSEVLDEMADLKRPTTGRTEMDILHEIATEGIGLAKTELSGLRKDVREAVGGISLPTAKTPEQREERKGRYRKALASDKRVEELGRKLFFGEG